MLVSEKDRQTCNRGEPAAHTPGEEGPVSPGSQKGGSQNFTRHPVLVKCADCRFARLDRTMCDRGWRAYKCGNPKSEYHQALLNVTSSGKKQAKITWCGCDKGEEPPTP